MLSTQLSAEDQAALDQMRDDDAGSPGIAPEPTEAPVHEPEAEETAETTDKPRQRLKSVPYSALHEEREERKKLASQLAEERRARQLLDERTNLLLQRMNQPAEQKPDEAPIPELEKDPVGHITARQAQLERQQQWAAQQAAQQQQAIAAHLQQQAVQQAITQRAQGLEREFEGVHPDYGDAVKFLMQKRAEELGAIGVPAENRKQQIDQEGMALAVHAMQQGRNPAELIYALSQMRGYKAGTNSYAPGSADTTETIEHTPAPAQRLQNIATAQRASRSLSDARGSGPVPLTAARLLEMSNAEFDKMMQTPEGMALMGKGG